MCVQRLEVGVFMMKKEYGIPLNMGRMCRGHSSFPLINWMVDVCGLEPLKLLHFGFVKIWNRKLDLRLWCLSIGLASVQLLELQTRVILLRVSCLKLEIKAVRCYEAKIEESEKNHSAWVLS